MSELIGPQWGDVDFHGRFIEVRRGVVLGQETTTKNHKIRRVDMSPQLQTLLQRLKEVRQLDVMNDGGDAALGVPIAEGTPLGRAELTAELVWGAN